MMERYLGKLTKVAAAISGLMMLSASHAPVGVGYCSQPMAPMLSIYSKPNKPFCVATRSCSQWDVDNYRNEIDSYYVKLKRYLADVDAFSAQAYDYAKCMADLD
jgi:hypothetical protein